MGRKILLCAAAIFAFNFGGFAQEEEEEDAVMILEENNATKTEAAAEENKGAAAETKDAEKPAQAAEEIAEEKAVEDVKEETKKEEAIKESVEKAGEKVKEENAAETEKEAEIVKAAEKTEGAKEAKEETKEGKSSFSWLNPMNWFSSDESTKKQDVKEEAKSSETAKAPEQELKDKGEPAAAAQPQEEKESSPSVIRTAILWLPNILIDLSDIISIDGGVGSESALEVDLTKYFGIGGALGEKYFIQKGYDRQFGGGYSSGWDFQFLCFNTEKRYVEDTFGSTKKYYVGRKYFELADPENHTYHDKVRDFYAASVKAGWLLVLGLDIHPVEIADFIASIFFLDISGDNLK